MILIGHSGSHTISSISDKHAEFVDHRIGTIQRTERVGLDIVLITQRSVIIRNKIINNKVNDINNFD